MKEETARQAVGVLAVLLVVVIAVTALVMWSRGGDGGPAASPTGAAGATPTPAASSSPTALPTETASAEPSESPSPSPTPSPTPTPTPVPVPSASLTFLNLKLSSVGGADSQERFITFTSEGPATISVQIVTHGDKIPTRTCLRAGTRDIGCKEFADGTYTGKTTQAKTNWRVSLIGTNEVESPLIDVTVTFPSTAPSVKIAQARFDGTDLTETNGIQVRFVPRATGDARLVASWGGHPFLYEVDTFNETTGSGGQTYPNQGPATKVDLSTPVTGGDTWRLVLQNIEQGFGATPLNAAISWP